MRRMTDRAKRIEDEGNPSFYFDPQIREQRGNEEGRTTNPFPVISLPNVFRLNCAQPRFKHISKMARRIRPAD